MIKIKAKDLINSEEFVREPVDNEVNEILESNNKKIIISGPKGTGKSTVLCSLEQRGLGSREQTINICPDAVVTLKKEPEGRFGDKEFESFHELQFTNYILRYIKNNYPIMFNKCFYKEERQANELTYIQINKSFNHSFLTNTRAVSAVRQVPPISFGTLFAEKREKGIS